HNTGALVFIRNHKPKSKTDSKNFGPYRVAQTDKEITPNILLENPWVGTDSQFKAHSEDVFPLNSTTPKRELTPTQEYQPGAKEAGTHKEFITKVKEHLQVENLSYLHLIGKKIELHWAQAKVKGWWKGTIVDYDPQYRQYWIRYEIASKDGTRHYMHNLLRPKHTEWRFNNK
ncbi:MAG: hypothetical protein ACXV2C_01360, partial [Candidatus Bathyarchaeia archaeon]